MDKKKLKKFIEDLQAMAVKLDDETELEEAEATSILKSSEERIALVSEATESETSTASASSYEDCFTTTTSSGEIIPYGTSFVINGGGYFSVEVDFEQLISFYGATLDTVSKCELCIWGKTRVAHPDYSLYTLPANEYIGDFRTTHNLYYIDLLDLYRKYGSASFKFVAGWTGSETLSLNSLECEGITLKSIAITTEPTKTSYFVGNKFNSNGMVVTGTYSDGSAKEITGYTITPSGELTRSDRYVTISYNGCKTTQAVDVNKQKVEFAYEVQMRTRTGEKADWSDWEFAIGANSYISVFATSTKEYRTVMKIDKSLIDMGDYKKTGLRLMLTLKSDLSSVKAVKHIKINNIRVSVNPVSAMLIKKFNYFIAYVGNLNADDEGDLEVIFEYDDYALDIYADGEYEPVLYFTNETDPSTQVETKTVDLSAGAININLATGVSNYEITDVKAEDSPLGLTLSHILTQEDDSLKYGAYYRLNLCERLDLDAINSNGIIKSHLYTDSYGERHSFNVLFYYLLNNERQYIPRDEWSNIVIYSADNIKYKEYSVNVEQITVNNQIFLSEPSSVVLNNTYYKSVLSSADNEKILPVSWLKCDTVTKGFNASGDLVLIIDGFGNYIAINYNSRNLIEKVFDANGNYINFYYKSETSGYYFIDYIIDSRYNKVKYTYVDRMLTKLDYCKTEEDLTTDTLIKTVTISYTKITSNGVYVPALLSVSTSDQMMSQLEYDGNALNGKLVSVKQLSIVDTGSGETEEMSSLSIEYDYEKERTILTDDYGNQVVYCYTDGDKLSNYYEIKNGLVSVAKKYEYESYTSYTEIMAVPSVLNIYTLDRFVFKSGEKVVTELNEFNLPTGTSVSGRYVTENAYLNEDGTYTYNNDHKCIKTVCTEQYYTTSSDSPLFKNNIVTNNIYNTAGNLVKTVIHKSHYENDTEITETANVTEYVYNTKGDVIQQITYNIGNPTHSSLESCNCSASSTTDKFYSEYEYDDNRRIITEKDETGLYSDSYLYYTGTNCIQTTSPSGRSNVNYAYDLEDRVTQMGSTIDGSENANYTTYENGKISKLNHSGRNDINFLYDAKRRISTILFGETVYEEYTYEDNVKSGSYTVDRATKINANGEEFLAEADRAGSYTKAYYNNSLLMTKEYGKDGLLKSITDKVSKRNISYSYDLYGNMTSYTEGSGTDKYSESYSYTVKGQIEEVEYTGIVSRTDMYTYSGEADDKVSEFSTGAFTVVPKVDINGRYTGKIVYINTQRVYSEGIAYRKEGDHATNMPIKVTYLDEANKSSIIPYNYLYYSYDEQGNIATVSDMNANNASISYTYDSLGRLIREDNRDANKSYLFTYDENGNILSKTTASYTTGDLSGGTVRQYVYDKDRLILYGAEEFEYDAVGNPVIYRNKELEWTRGKKLISFNGNTFDYDAQGRRTRKNDITFYYDSQGRLIKQSNGLEFFYDSNGKLLGLSYNGEYYAYRLDAQGNVKSILDSNGKGVVGYWYDAWGNIVATTNVSDSYKELANLNPFRYRGYYYDTETGLYYLKTRYYDPEIGRFINMDSIDYADPETINGLNLYAYCNNNPVMNIDPDGTWSWKGVFKIVTAVAVVALAVTVAVATAGTAVGVIAAGAAIGATAGMTIGGTAAAINAVNNGEDVFEAVADGMLGGSVAGAVVGGTVAALGVTAGSVGGSLGSLSVIGGGTVNTGGGAAVKLGIATLGAILFDKWIRGSWPGDDPTIPPGDDFIWRGPGTPGSKYGEWYNPYTKDQLHPDLNHPLPKGPHWGWRNKILKIMQDIFKGI